MIPAEIAVAAVQVAKSAALPHADLDLAERHRLRLNQIPGGLELGQDMTRRVAQSVPVQTMQAMVRKLNGV